MNKVFTFLSSLSYGKTLVLGLVLGVFYYFTIYNDGSSLDAELSSINQQLVAEEEKKKDTDNTLRQVKEMQERVGQLSVQFQEVSRRLPAELFSIDINRAIDGFAKSSGVNVKVKRPGINVKKEVVEEVPVDIVLEGSYSELTQFTYYVSAAERMSRVINIVITDDGNKNNKNLRFEGQVVGYKLATETPKEEKPQ